MTMTLDNVRTNDNNEGGNDDSWLRRCDCRLDLRYIVAFLILSLDS